MTTDTTSKMLPMEYGTERKRIILASGTYNGVPYWIFSYGTHPCAYVEVTKFPDLKPDEIQCHGGITYDEHELKGVWDKSDDVYEICKRRFIGWDYAHSSDYVGNITFTASGHMWTTEDIFDEVQDVINQLPAASSATVTETGPETTSQDENKEELVRQFFTAMLENLNDLSEDEIFEGMDDELLEKFDLDEVRKEFNFQTLVDVVKLGVWEKFKVRFDF